MLHLLMDTSIFIPLPNGCLCQLTGEPIIHIAPQLLGTDGHGINMLKSKRSRENTENTCLDDERLKKRAKYEILPTPVIPKQLMEGKRFDTYEPPKHRV